MQTAQVRAYQVLQKARQGRYAVGAFNVSNFETLKAVVAAASNLAAPVIVETSEGETAFVTARVVAAMVKAYREKTGLPILLNLDHAHSFEAVETAANAGYQLLHYDGSRRPYQENVAVLKEVVEFANLRGDLVEGELDHVPGSSAPHLQERIESRQKKVSYTDPEKAAKFVAETGIDILAVFVGNVHGVYQSSPQLDFERLQKIAQKLVGLDCFLSLHGGSGIAAEQIRKAIQVGGVVKINVNTELRMAYRKTLEQVLEKNQEVALYKILPPVVAAVQKVVEGKIRLFGSEGKA